LAKVVKRPIVTCPIATTHNC